MQALQGSPWLQARGAEWQEDDRSYKPGTGILGESWARACQDWGNPMHMV